MKAIQTKFTYGLSKREVDSICKIKDIFWPYGVESQLNWFKDNISRNDLHFLSYDGKTLVAYLNLIDIVVKINSYDYLGYGFGNLCSLIEGKGHELMKAANQKLISESKVGLLFCKEKLIKYHEMTGWQKVCRSKIKINHDNSNFFTMIRSFDLSETEIITLEYNGKLF